MRYCGRGAGRWSAAVPAHRRYPVDGAHFEQWDRVFECFRRSFRRARRECGGPRRTRGQAFSNVLVDHRAVTDIDRSRRAVVGSDHRKSDHGRSDHGKSDHRKSDHDAS
jgi:hypothetical protein